MSNKKKICFALILVVSFLALVEIFSKIIFDRFYFREAENKQTHVFHPLAGHAHAPHSVIRKDWKDLVTDENGYLRSDSFADGTTVRILLTGSSSVRNQQPYTISDNSLARLIEHYFWVENDIHVQVMNTAVGGHKTFQEFMMMFDYFEENNLTADFIISTTGLASIRWFARSLDEILQENSLYHLYDATVVDEIRGYESGSFVSVLNLLVKYLRTLDISTVLLVDNIINGRPTKHMIMLNNKKK